MNSKVYNKVENEMSTHKLNQDKEYIKVAIEMAYNNVLENSGGPFGAIVVKDGKIVGRGRNEVTTKNDPTAHAEVQAIRDACKNLGTFQLTDCEIYTSCEPCPMCIGAIYWARPKAVYYAYTKHDAAKIGFDDEFIYKQLELSIEERDILMKKLETDNSKNPFEAWKESNHKVNY